MSGVLIQPYARDVLIRSTRTLGVLGGLGPAAGAQFLTELAAAVPARRDQDHPRVLMLSDPSVPDRSRALLSGSEAPLVPLRAGLQTLVSWGADLLAVPCNTAHAFIDQFAPDLPVPLVHIVDATLRAAVRVDPDGAWLLATRGTIAAQIYQSAARSTGFTLLIPPDEVQVLVDDVIAAAKAGHFELAADQLLRCRDILRRRLDRPLLAACTEIPLAAAWARLPPSDAISSLRSLAEACVAELYPDSALRPADLLDHCVVDGRRSLVGLQTSS